MIDKLKSNQQLKMANLIHLHIVVNKDKGSFFSILFIWALVRFKFPTSLQGPWRQNISIIIKMTKYFHDK